jgi:hypothetical protein
MATVAGPADPTGSSAATGPAGSTDSTGSKPRAARWRSAAGAALRVEDLLLVAWIGLANPLLARAQGNPDPFASGHPIDGLIGLAGVLGALICLATRTAGAPATSDRSIIDSGIAGPVTAGLMLVGASSFAGLGLAPEGALLPLFAAVVVVPGLRGHAPALQPAVRRALMMPFVLAAGGIFWTFIRGITGGAALFADPGAFLAVAPSVAPVLGLLGLFAAFYYAMLVYAPRQIAEPEGGLTSWLLRFGLFLVSVLFGFGWLGLLGS